ncbi:MAG: 3-oxoacyl-[acyl-carrier-protein] synthase III C-terminal domain-containing protein, partial [Leptolyngbya sp.]|nr:3-oxoacyl-[acyl-carrier-protein] synthase III C-terminal domain-containing protein [Leptolyngbya sp.]
PAGGTRIDFHRDPDRFAANAVFSMDGHGLFKLTRTRLPEFVDRLLKTTGWSRNDVDVVVPHQASPLALEHMVRRCGFPASRVVNTVRDTGNLVAASLPITLDTALRSGQIQPGAKVLMIGTSAGVSIGGATLQA